MQNYKKNSTKMFYRIFFKKMSVPIAYSLIAIFIYYFFFTLSYYYVSQQFSVQNFYERLKDENSFDSKWIFFWINLSFKFFRYEDFNFFVLLFFYFLPILIWSYYLRLFYRSDYYKRIILLNGNKKTFRYIGLYLVIFWFLIFLIINLVSLKPIDYLYKYLAWKEGGDGNYKNYVKWIPWLNPFTLYDSKFKRENFPYNGFKIGETNFFYLENKFYTHIFLMFLSFFTAIAFVSVSFYINKWILYLIYLLMLISLIIDGSKFLDLFNPLDEAFEYIGSELKFKKFLVKIPFSFFNPYSLLDVFASFHFLSKKITINWLFPVILISIFNFSVLAFSAWTMRRNFKYSFL
ncbi:hypothetical protein DEH79_00215 [Mycoplasmopsis synoviae]|nr:hypothetical protein MSHv_05000 [Mycoplasmopsis synoviae]AQU48297.1 hypothetical protein ADF19_05000 [Mycoplasmopsis synoviae]AWL83880.1 hypothetical protein MSH_00220 [Mycoplasmopsis synoviae]QLE13609.1 hypothetical protein DEH79_00215 [Mycoplasmopsis synoviae]